MNQVSDNEYSVLKRFTHCQKDLYSLGKHIINTRRTGKNVIYNNPHILQFSTPPLREFSSIDTNLRSKCRYGRIYDYSDSEPIELYHFRNKTWTENVKRKNHTDDAYWPDNNTMNPRKKTIEQMRIEFDEYNHNEISNTKLRDILYGHQD